MKINFLAVLVCVIVAQLIGMIWFGFIFGGSWMAMNGFSPQAQMSSGAMPYIYSVIDSAFFALFLSWLFNRMAVRSAMEGAGVALFIGVAAVLLGVVTGYSFAGRPMRLALIDACGPMLWMTVMGTIIGGWKTKAQKSAKVRNIIRSDS